MSQSFSLRTKSFLAGLVLPLLLGACESSVSVRGNFPDPEEVGSLEKGVHTRRDVADKLGSPSTLSTFQDQVWYYIGEKVEKTAFYDPVVLDRTVLIVKFSSDGVLEESRAYALEDGRVIDPVTRETPTEGQDITIIQQLLGNLGKFNPGSKK
ncbi:outer membrane protein assembly factor BamE [Kiloniella laminariae]|uniref:outer membrane protein assembly factor BamE n=1 Tax=Kiloniella laminariae TaxID=454162 RepID=UPI0005267B0F|nr:outer membrane protein assembly factor BamE [Kiloniella laminariae]